VALSYPIRWPRRLATARRTAKAKRLSGVGYTRPACVIVCMCLICLAGLTLCSRVTVPSSSCMVVFGMAMIALISNYRQLGQSFGP